MTQEKGRHPVGCPDMAHVRCALHDLLIIFMQAILKENVFCDGNGTRLQLGELFRKEHTFPLGKQSHDRTIIRSTGNTVHRFDVKGMLAVDREFMP